MTSRGKRVWRWLAGSVAAIVILAALAVGAFRLALELLPEYEARVADTVREATGLRLSFDALDARLGRYGPEIFFEGARIMGPDGSDVIVSARAGRASLSLLRSLFHRRLEIGRVVLEGPRLNFVIFPDRHIELVGQAWLAQPTDPTQESRGLQRIPRGRIEVRDASVGFLDLRADRAAWELQGVDVGMHRKGSTVSLMGRVRLPRHLGASLEFEAEVAGDLAQPRALSWQGRIAGRDLSFAGWADLLPATFTLPPAGRGSLSVSARGAGGAWLGGRVRLDLADVALPATEGPPAAVYRRLAGELVAEYASGSWRVRGEKIELSLADSPWSPTDLAADLDFDEGLWVTARVRAGFIRLENLMPLLRLLPASAARQRLEALAPRGTLIGTDLQFARSADRLLPDVTGWVAFEDLGFAPHGRAPGVAGLDGRLDGAGPGGVITLAAQDVQVDWPAEWRSVVPFARVHARVEWSPGPGGVRLWVDDAHVNAGHVQAGGRVRLLLRPGETPLMDIKANASVTDVAAVPQYLPTSRIGARSLAWLDQAFVAGRVPEVRVEITGPARGFPYREGQGRFSGTARGEDVTLRFAPGWQPLSGLFVTAHFLGPGMTADASQAVIGGVTVGKATAEMRDWRDSRLIVRAEAAGDAAAVLGLLQDSPLRATLGETFGRLTGTGPVLGELVMYLPFKEFSQRSVTVRAHADGVALGLPGMAEPLGDLRGTLWVQNREIQAPALSARFLGGPLRARIDTTAVRGGGLVTTVDMNGTVEGARLPGVVRLPLEPGLAGATAWRGTWTASRPAGPGGITRTRIRLEGDLKGLGSGLPAPFAKLAEEARPLRVEVDLDGTGTVLARLGLGANVRGLVEYRRRDGSLSLTRGVLRFGGAEVASLPVGPGLRIDGRLPYLSLTDLTDLRWEKPAARPLQDQLSTVTLEVGRLEVLGYEFERVNAELRPGNRVWDVRVSAPAAQGRLSVPYEFPGTAPLVADLDRLVVAERVRPGTGEPDPQRLPAMRLDVRDLSMAGRTLGHVRSDADRTPAGLVFKSLVAEHPAFTLRGSGDWLMSPTGPRSTLVFELSSGDVKGLLQALAFEHLIDAREGTMAADLSWPGGPDAQVPERVSGTVSIALAKGRMVSVEPGAGRILGLLSVAHLPRRLALDFKDLTGQGMAFDSISGDFTLAAGDAYTDNLTLRGPAAEIGIAGRTSLRERNYDQTAVVTGAVGGTLGVAGALAGGPVVGAALLLFSQVFKEPLKGVARGYYRISGTWEEPIVRKIDARELEEAAGLGQPPPAAGTGPAAGAPR